MKAVRLGGMIVSTLIKKPRLVMIPRTKSPGIKKRDLRKIGLPPGTPVYVGEERKEKVRITLMNYDKDKIEEKEFANVDECCEYAGRSEVTWINVDGIHDIETIEKLGKAFGVHPLVLEDIAHTDQRPKMEDYKEYLYIVLRMFHMDQENGTISSEQVSIILGTDHIISFQEHRGDVFDMIRNRIRQGKGRIRSLGDDYLAYTIIDSIVDQYFVILERLGEIIESNEDDLVKEPTPKTLAQLYDLKKEMIILRKSIWPLREVISKLERGDSELITKDTTKYLRDIYDHTIQAIDTIETYRDMLSGMLDLYLSSASNKMNEVMKVLTIIATIFIPLTFITGVYGMNFQYMPELAISWTYPLVWVVMIVMVMGMLIYFRRRNWI
jgi:magnesium transporter